jgi:L-alanine-DL-glutamate epimerase-like enolase superfamily enzyme
MKITAITYERLDLTLTEPYTIAYETIDRAVNFILYLETDKGIVGRGCAAPDMVVTKESPEDVETAIQEVIVPALTGRDPLAYVRLIHEMKTLLPGKASARAMVDAALFDLVAKVAGMPLYKFLGGYRDRIPTSITVGILPAEETLRRVAEFQKQGFRHLKIKGGSSVDEDIEKMMLLHERFPDLIWRFDANQGYSLADSVRFVDETLAAGIEILEQPTPYGADALLGEVTERVDIPVMADESLRSLRDAFRLARHDRIDMVNIKLMKVGGIWEAMSINSVGAAAGLETMVGCLDECSLGISAGLHFALSRPNVEFADLDGHLDFEHDPFKGIFDLRKGILYPSEKAGLG